MRYSTIGIGLRLLFVMMLTLTSALVQLPQQGSGELSQRVQAATSQTCGTPTEFTAVSTNADAIRGEVEEFRDAIGVLNAPNPINHLDGRRQINWDAAPDAVSAPNTFAGDFFNFNAFPRARGIAFETTGTEFQLSATEASGVGIEFDNIDATYSSQFNTYSAERLFAPIGANTVDVYFFSPSDQTTPALVDSFGAIFTDVDKSETTKIDFYDVNDTLVHTIYANAVPGSETLSLAAAHFSQPCVRWVRITAGNIGLGAGINEANNDIYDYDVVAMDDFIYGEPQPITSCGLPTIYASTGNSPDAIRGEVENYRTALGALNAPAPFNNLDGRRQINWDAAPDAVSAPNSFTGNFFNFNAAPRARGISFSTQGTDFQLSATAASGEGIEFDNINANYSAIFQTYSAERLFTAIDSNVVRGDFFNPAQQTTSARVDGFGAVFSDVDLGAATTIEYYDANRNLLYKLGVQPEAGDEGLSFAGAKFDSSCVEYVIVTNGTSALGADINDDPDNDIDLVVMDDFIYGEPIADTVCGLPEIFTSTGGDADAIRTEVNAYRDALGALNDPVPQNFDTGRRQINWDAAPDGVSAPNDFAGDFFNFNASPRARGIAFTTNGNGFQLSATEASGTGIEFANINANYASTFSTYSAERLFTAIGSNEVDARFFNPATQTDTALTNGFGAVFSDVDLADVTALRYYDTDNKLVYAQSVPAVDGNTQESLSFAGLTFDTACVARVRLVNGNTAIDANTEDDPANGVDLVVMDDFIYGEPIPTQTNVNALINLIRVGGSYSATPQENAPFGVFTLNAEFRNVGETPLRDMSFEITELDNNNVLLNATNDQTGVGASFPVTDLGEDNLLTAGETFEVDFVIGLQELRSFTLLANAFGGVGADATESKSLGWNYLMDANPERTAQEAGATVFLPVILR
ncbi:MAG: hypothetical protein AAF639_38750 [Chloroflexota bacterium]